MLAEQSRDGGSVPDYLQRPERARQVPLIGEPAGGPAVELTRRSGRERHVAEREVTRERGEAKPS